MRSIKTNQLPDWFDLSKYSTANELDLAGWLDNLLWRSDYLSCNPETLGRFRLQIETHFQETKALVATSGPYASGNIVSGGGLSDSEMATTTVWPLDVSYVLHMIADARHGDWELAQTLSAASELVWADSMATRLDDEVFDDETEQLLWQPIDAVEAKMEGIDPTSLHIEVDLAAPDKLIVEDFKNWLKAARQAFSIESRSLFTKADMRDWVKYRVLPFLDLALWALVEDVKIPDSVMGNALFPDEYDVDLPERIRKVVRPKTKWLIRPSVIQAIESQVLNME